MKCIQCGTKMILLGKCINYPEPSEWRFGCPCCYVTCDIKEAYGKKWEGLDEQSSNLLNKEKNKETE